MSDRSAGKGSPVFQFRFGDAHTTFRKRDGAMAASGRLTAPKLRSRALFKKSPDQSFTEAHQERQTSTSETIPRYRSSAPSPEDLDHGDERPSFDPNGGEFLELNVNCRS